jgi:hypothetical protein
MTRTFQVSRKSTVAMANCLAAVSPSVSLQDTLKVANFCGFLIGVSQSVSLSCLGGAVGVSTVSVSLDRDSETARENGTFLRFLSTVGGKQLSRSKMACFRLSSVGQQSTESRR